MESNVSQDDVYRVRCAFVNAFLIDRFADVTDVSDCQIEVCFSSHGVSLARFKMDCCACLQNGLTARAVQLEGASAGGPRWPC